MLKQFSEVTTPDLSVVICFRDWGLDRLVAAVRLHCVNMPKGITYEVVVSDFGSQDAEEVRRSVESAGGRVVRTETSAPWSRSQALNAGVKEALGKFVITTDADIVFTPAAYRAAKELLSCNPNALYLIQCRDLPSEWGASELLNHANVRGEVDFDAVGDAATIRPRWGMGGFAAFSIQSYYALNGYEERMKIWGKEDNDFAQRFRRLGMPLRWITDEDARIFHMWHAPSLTKANESEEGRASIKENQRILDKDESIVRNLKTRNAIARCPVVSVVIATYRRPDQLREALLTCQAQTFQNFEVVIVENGDSYGSDAVVESLKDPRFRYVKISEHGASVARNVGTREARGKYIVVHDDDDLMCSTRIEDHLRVLQTGDHGSYGGWIDFDDDAGHELSDNPGKEFSFESLLFSGKVLIHPGSMIRRDIMEAFPYDESRPAGIDYALFLKLARNGLCMRHTGNYAIFRRMHSRNMTRLNGTVQKASADYMKSRVLSEMPEEEKDRGRSFGRGVRTLTCRNGASARNELRELLAQRSQAQPKAVTLPNLASRLRKTGLHDESIIKELSGVSSVSVRGGSELPRFAYLASRLRYLVEQGSLDVDIIE